MTSAVPETEGQINLVHVVSSAFSTPFEKFSGVIATIAIFTKSWFPSLQDMDGVAAQLAPILGCVWLVLQIGFKLWHEVKVLRRARREGQ